MLKRPDGEERDSSGVAESSPDGAHVESAVGGEDGNVLAEWSRGFGEAIRASGLAERIDFAGLSRERGEWSLRLDSRGANWRVGRALVARDERVAAHLCSWPGGNDLLVLFRVESSDEWVPAVVVRNGGLWFVSLGGDEQTSALDGRENFAAWFARRFGVESPLPLEDAKFVRLDADLWGTPGLRTADIFGFPHEFRARTSSPYTLVGFGGHGLNSYACYFTREAPGVTIFLRMPFGGAYMDNDECARRLVEEIRFANQIGDMCVSLGITIEIVDNMASVDVTLQNGISPAPTKFSGIAGSWFWASVLRAIESKPFAADDREHS